MASGRLNTNLTRPARRGRLTAKDLIRYLGTPLHLPPFDVSRATYKQLIVDTIQDLLTSAIETILPSKVVGVQFVFAKRFKSPTKQNDSEVQADFSFPFLLCCSNAEEARGLADGLAYVTKYLTSHDSSFHLRVRKWRLTYSPAVCVFSTTPGPQGTNGGFDSTTVLWVQLPASEIASGEITFPTKFIVDQQPFDGRFFYQADLNPPIAQGLFDNEKLSSPEVTARLSSVQVIRESNQTLGEKKGLLRGMRQELSYDVGYLKRVAYLLKFGDVILCTPHAYDEIRSVNPNNPMNPHDMITDAGLTVMIDRRQGSITEDDWLRVQAVAQKLAIFAGAAVSTAIEARASILRTLNDGFEHEFRNAVNSIMDRLEAIEEKNMPLTASDITDTEGRLQFTQRYIDSAINMYKGDDVAIASALEDLIAPLRKYQDVRVETEYKLAQTDNVMNLWLPVLIEVIRNAYKYGLANRLDSRISISVSATRVGDRVEVAVTNELTNDTVRERALSNNPKGWDLLQEISGFLGGAVRAIPNGNQITTVVSMPVLGKSRGIYV